MPTITCFHYTSKDGHNGIRSAAVWRFLAEEPSSGHPRGAYFTDLAPGTFRLAYRLRVLTEKTEFVFVFTGERVGFRDLSGGRGDHIFYSPEAYHVEEARQRYHGHKEGYST